MGPAQSLFDIILIILTKELTFDPKGVDTVLHSSLKTFLPRPLQWSPLIRHLNANDQGKNQVAGTWRRGIKQNITTRQKQNP